MKKENKKQVYLSGIERFMLKIGSIIIITLIVLIVCSETSLAKINVEVQKLNKEVDEQKKINESLNMKIDEMTSLDNIKEVSEKYGLKYNSENIKTIE